MKASYLVGPMRSEIREVPLPEIGDDDVLLRVAYVGVCASELHPWQEGIGGRDGILGHEPIGYVAKVGKNVSDFNEGDRVTALGYACFSEYAKVPAHCVVHVPSSVKDREALGEPLACLFSAAERTPVSLGDICAIVGLGYMGLVMMNLIVLKGAGQMIAVDTRPECGPMAFKHGADVFYTPDQVPERMKLTEWADMSHDFGIDIACEVSGSAPALKLAGEMVHQHGVLNIVGYHQGGPRTVDMQLWNWKALNIVNGHERREDHLMRSMGRALRLIEAGKLSLDHLVTHEFALDAVDEAFQALMAKPGGYIKGVIRL